MTGFVSNTAMEVINGRYIDAWTDSQFLLDLFKMIKHLAGITPGRLPSGQCVHYHILKAIFHQAEFSAQSDIFFCLKKNWWRVSIKRQKKISFCMEDSARWKTTLMLLGDV